MQGNSCGVTGETGVNMTSSKRGAVGTRRALTEEPPRRPSLLSPVVRDMTAAVMSPVVAREGLEKHHLFPLALEEVKKEWDPVFTSLNRKCRHEEDDGNIRAYLNRRWLRFVSRARKARDMVDGGRKPSVCDEAIDPAKNMISLDCLIKWSENMNKVEMQKMAEGRSGIDSNTLVLILERYKKTHQKDCMSREEFYQLIQKFHEESSSENLELHQKIIKMFAYADIINWWPPPLFMLILSITEFGFFIYHIIYLSEWFNLYPKMDNPVPYCSMWIFNPKRQNEPWRYITYGLVHGGISHALFNFLFQLVIGVPLELTNSWWRVGIVYLSGLLSGSLVTHLLDPKIYLAGSSGGVYALIAAHLSSIIFNWHEDEMVSYKRMSCYKEMRFIRSKQVRVGRLLTILLFAVVDTSISVYSRYGGTDSSGPNTGYLAHLGGAVGGLLVGLLVLRNRRTQRWETVTKTVLLCFILLSYIVLIILNAGAATWWPDSFDEEEDTSWGDSEKKCQEEIYKGTLKNTDYS